MKEILGLKRKVPRADLHGGLVKKYLYRRLIIQGNGLLQIQRFRRRCAELKEIQVCR